MNTRWLRAVSMVAALVGGSSITHATPEGFESGWGDWYTDSGVWQVGATPEAHEGAYAAGTVLDGPYPANSASRLISPVHVLPSVSADESIQLRFWQSYSYARSDSGQVQVRVWNGATWGAWQSVAMPALGADTCTTRWSDWSVVGVDLTLFAGETIEIGFFHSASDSSSCSSSDASTGWFLDEVEVLLLVPPFADSPGFELGWGDWTTDHGVWEVGPHPEAFAGTSVAATVLDASYPPNTNARLISPAFDLPDAPADGLVELRFWQAYSYARADRGDVEVSEWDGTTWGAWETLATPAPSQSSCSTVWSDWSKVSVDLTRFAGERVRVAFSHSATDSSSCSSSDASSGWMVDSIEIVAVVPPFDIAPGFESGWGDWSTDQGVWEIGIQGAWPMELAPDGCVVAATVLDGSYPPDADSRLISPPLELPMGPSVKLCFTQAYSYGRSDQGDVQVAVWNGMSWGPWESVDVPAPGTNSCSLQESAWSQNTCVNLAAYGGERVRIAFRHVATDSSSCTSPDASHGWYIADVEIIGSLTFCRGDVDGDNDTDVYDFAEFLINFGVMPDGSRSQGDLVCDGSIDVFDFAVLVEDFGCSP